MHRTLLLLALLSPLTSAQPLRAGAATSNITPFLGGAIVGNFVTPPAAHIHDELHARCLVLDDGKTRLVFVVCDNVGISREVYDEAKRQIRQATQIPAENMLMSATHTHSATAARWKNSLEPGAQLDEYQSFVAHRIADGVRRAVNNLEPARIAWGAAEEPRAVFNRRYTVKPGTELLNPFGQTGDQVKMNPGYGNPAVIGPAGPTDPQISFISVQSTVGRPIALLANYSLHYVGGIASDEISADYFAAFADKIQQRLNADRLDPPFVGIMSNGTSGDVNNINAMAATRPAKQKPYEQINRIADMLADDVFKAHQSLQFRDSLTLRSATRELTLKTRKPTAEMIDRARKILAGEIKPKNLEEPYAQRTIDLADSPDQVSVPLQAFAVGDLAVAGIPFEIFAAAGLEIKARSPFKSTFTISQANGAYGYLPTAEQHKVGGYETWLGTNRVEVDASTKIVDQILRLFDKLKTQQKPN